MRAVDWIQYIRLEMPETLAVKIHPRGAMPVWARLIETESDWVTFEVGFRHGREVESWDVDMLEAVVSDAVVDVTVGVVPVQESPFNAVVSGEK